MRSWAKLKVEENPGLGRIYRNNGGMPIGGEVAVRILDDHAMLEVFLTGLRPLGGDIKVLRGPLAAAASPMAYQVWLFSEWDESSVMMGLLNADQNGSARMVTDFDPNDVCRIGTSINGFDYVAITPLIEGCDSIGAMTIAFTRLPGDLTTFQDRPAFPNWLAPGPDDKEKGLRWETGGKSANEEVSEESNEEATGFRTESEYPWEPCPAKGQQGVKTCEHAQPSSSVGNGEGSTK